MSDSSSSESEAPTEAVRPDPALTASTLEGLKLPRGSAGPRRRSALRRFAWPLILLLLVIIGIGGLVTVGPFAGMFDQVAVTTSTVRRESAVQSLVRTSASGYVVARTRAAISSRLSGRLEKLLVDVGDRVEEGQLLGQLGQQDLIASVAEAEAMVAARTRDVAALERDREQAQAAVAAARQRLASSDKQVIVEKERLAEAQRQLALEQKLVRDGVSAGDEVNRKRALRDIQQRVVTAAESQVRAAQAEVTQARSAVEAYADRIEAAQAAVKAAGAARDRAEALRADADIRAPFSGIVLRKEAEVGEMVSPVNSTGSTTRGAIVTVADFGSLEMVVDVIERDIGRVEQGLPCRIVLDSRKDAPYLGRVRQVVPTADRTRGTVEVKITFDRLDEHLYPEMSGRADFLEPDGADKALADDLIRVPAAALVTRDGKQGVFVVDGGVARFTAVVTRADDGGGDPIVTSGLKGGETVVVDPPVELEDGGAVSATES